MRALLIFVAMLGACAPQAENRFPDPVGVAEPLPYNDPAMSNAALLSPRAFEAEREAEMARIERHCLAETEAGRQLPGYDCGFGSYDDALRWKLAWERVNL